MPTFSGQISEEEVIQLIAYLRSLSAGAELPPRVEAFPPPVRGDELKQEVKELPGAEVSQP
jgi:hypothetical protein